jgi:hypothetical protein
MPDNKCQGGVIKTTSRYAIDGEFCVSNHEYNASVTECWGKTKNFKPKEVKTIGGTYYRQTSQSGWRRYNKESKKFYNTSGINLSIIFVENIDANPSNNISKVTLGCW